MKYSPRPAALSSSYFGRIFCDRQILMRQALYIPSHNEAYYNNSKDAAVLAQFYFTVSLLYMFRVLSTPIIRSKLTVSTASGTGHTSVQLPSSNVAKIKLGHVGGR